MRYIGFSVSRCVRDIVKGKINYNTVEVVVGRTLIENEQHVAEVARTYHGNPASMQTSWSDLDYKKCYDTLLKLYTDGKLHQPRLYGATPIRRDSHWCTIAPFPMNY